MSTVWQNTTGALEFFPPPGWVGCCLPPAAALQLSPAARAPARVPRVAPLRAKTYLCKSGQVLFVQVWSSALQKNCANRQPIQATIGGGGRPRFPPCSVVQVSGRGVHLANFRQPFALLRSLFFATVKNFRFD